MTDKARRLTRETQLVIVLLLGTYFFYPVLFQIAELTGMSDGLYATFQALWKYGSLLAAFLLLRKIGLSSLWSVAVTRRRLLLFVGYFGLLFLWAIVSMHVIHETANAHAITEAFDSSTSQLSETLLLVWLIVLGPIREELLFRGLLITSLDKWVKPSFSLLMSSAFFSLYHLYWHDLHLTDAINYVVSGYIFARFFRQTGSISWSIGLHIVWNTFVYYMSTR